MLCTVAHGQLDQSKIPNPRSKIAAHPFLWKIEGGKKPSWLFGTIHLQRPDVATVPPTVSDALDHSDAVYTEIPSDMASMLALTPKMLLTGDQKLDSILGSDLTADLARELQSRNPPLPLQPVEHFKPWAVAALLLELEDQMKYPSALALDMVLFQRGAAAGKETGGIEKPEEQLAVFDEFSPAEQAAMVRDTIKQLRDFRARGQSPSDFLANLYLAGDLDALVNELNKMDAGEDPALSAKFLDRLLYRRNAIMAARILQRLHNHPETSYFFAVGAAHLQGDRGLIAALEKAGFHLTRVP